MSDAYYLILAVHIAAVFQLAATNAGSSGVGIYDVTLDLGNDEVGV